MHGVEKEHTTTPRRGRDVLEDRHDATGDGGKAWMLGCLDYDAPAINCLALLLVLRYTALGNLLSFAALVVGSTAR
jgi:hypothetical protein